jgi:hypothetical protein
MFWQEEQLGDGSTAMAAEIVHNDDVAGGKREDQQPKPRAILLLPVSNEASI